MRPSTPQQHASLGELQPSAEIIAKAIAGRDRTRLQPSGAYAANLLGLSEQVPMKVVFLTDGPSRLVRVGPMTIQLRRTTLISMASFSKAHRFHDSWPKTSEGANQHGSRNANILALRPFQL